MNPSSVEAGWTDSMMFSSDLLPPGFPLFIEGTLLVTGSAEARVIGGPVGGFRLGLAQAGLKVIPVGFVMTPPYPGGYYAYTADDLAHTQTASLPAPETLAIALLTINKQSVATGFRLSLTGQANSSSGITSAGSVGASFDADFSRTLKWGGITRVSNSETGEEIADWTVTSESGFDYSKPFEVPEPSRPLAFAAVASGLALRTRRDRLPRQRRE